MRLIDADKLLRRYDEEHEGSPGRARKLIEEAPTVVGWISVKDRLPEDDREVLAAYKMTGKDMKFWGVETASCIAGNGEVNWISLWDEYRIPNGSKRVITHWMPLPKPPKEKEND